MSSPLKKKTSKKKKKKMEEDGPGPQKHKRIGNLNYFSEEISKEIIEKLISLAVSKNFNVKVEKKYGNFCYQALKRTFDNIIEITHIDHDKDDFDIDNIDINSYIKTNKSDSDIKRFLISNHSNALKTRNENVKKRIKEIAKINRNNKTYVNVQNKKIEDCLNKSAIIKKNKYLKKTKKFQYKIEIKKKNFWGDIPSPSICGIDRSTSNFNNYKKRIEEFHKNNITNNKKEENMDDKDSKKKSHFSYREFNIGLSKKLFKLKGIKGTNYEEIFGRKKRFQILDMPSYPIENLFENNETDEIINLRKEKLEMILQKEKELKKEQMLKLKMRKEEEKKAKIKKNGKFTFDNDGNLISVNEIKQENLSKEFWQVSTKQKEIKPGEDIEIYKEEKIEMENKAKKNIIHNDEEENEINPHHLKLRLTEPFINLNDPKKNNPKDSFLKSKRRFEGLLFGNLNNKKIQPSGSNFQLINPSVGVKIKEKSFVKNGGNDYYKEFKKFSMEEFNKTLQDNIEWTKYKQNDEKVKLNEGFKTTISNELQNLKKINFIKDTDESNDILNNIGYSNENNNYYMKRIKNHIKKKIKRKNFGKTFTDSFNKNEYKKSLLKSTSEIVLDNEKFINLKKLLFHDNKDNFIGITPYNNNHKKIIRLFKNYRNKSSGRRKDESPKIKKRFEAIDNLNKNLMTGKTTNQTIIYNKIVLPKISIRNSETNFHRTMMNFNRHRTKKVIEDNSLKKDSSVKVKRLRKVNSVKLV